MMVDGTIVYHSIGLICECDVGCDMDNHSFSFNHNTLLHLLDDVRNIHESAAFGDDSDHKRFDEIMQEINARVVLLTRDGLTGCFRAELFFDKIVQECEIAARLSQPLALMLIDVDGLKNLNDTHGHKAGSAAIAGIGAAVISVIRAMDFPARIGGDEFAILLPNTNSGAALDIALRLRSEIDKQNIPHAPTVSIGVAGLLPTTIDPQGLFENADISLYVAKRAGRNQVRAWCGGMEHHRSHVSEVRFGRDERVLQVSRSGNRGARVLARNMCMSDRGTSTTS